MELQQNTLVVVASLLSLERVFYAIVCHAPAKISRLADVVASARGKEPEFIFKTVHFFKLVALPSVTVCIAAAALLAVGQVLNFAVWYRIGSQGVCYGVKFGRNVPWCTQFPYNVMNDPQYVGAILTVWGLFLLVSESAPQDWMMIPVIETLYYAVSMKVEY